MIKAPYNFVPLSKKVVMPFWADHISQDIPFENARSGSLKLKITAKSPIYVRNGVPRNMDKEDPKRNEFNNIQEQYFIPGSSIKGMLRSVVEIMSFGRMKNKVNPDRYSVRDFQNNDIYPKTDLSNLVECGWLYKVGDEYFIDKCGKPGRISHKNLDVLCGSEKISGYYKNPSNVRTDRDKSAKSKNEKFAFERSHRFIEDYNSEGRLVYKIDSSGRDGIIVMTGQASVRKEPEGEKASGKHLEFIFWEKKPTITRVSDEVIKNFFFAYYDHDKTQQKDDWKWRKSQLDKGEKIPVFYRTKEVNGKEEFLDIGLTMLYKIAYNHSILDSINNHQKNADSYDLAEAIFGFVDDQKALKGRVHIGHAFVSNGTPQRLDLETEVLAGPKASYYPNYIEQKIPENSEDGKIKGKYQTFMDENATIKGWKRYPVHSGEVKRNEPPTVRGKVNTNVATQFFPLPKGTEFTVDIAYHNLRKEELGALISAITFHNTDGLFHSIGSAKPLGYGKVEIIIEEGLDEAEQTEVMKAYETYMDYALGHSSPLWFQSEQIKELMAMAKPGNDDSKLAYMELKEFANKKGKKWIDPRYALLKYSFISENQVDCTSLSSSQELIDYKIAYDKEKEAFKNLKDISELKDGKLKQEEKKLKEFLTELKEKLLQEIKESKANALQKEKEYKEAKEEKKRLLIKAERQDEAKKKGFILSDDFKVDDRNAFENLSKELMFYARSLFNVNEKQLKELKKNEAWFKGNDVSVIIETVKEIYKNLPNKREIKKWNKVPLENNFAFRKIKDWIGEEKAGEIFEEIRK